MNCECKPELQPGSTRFYCDRHQCHKTKHWWKLCQRADYFEAWELGRGPGQHDPLQEPGLARKAVNYGKAVVKHVASGGKRVDDSVYEARLTICRECPSLDEDRMVCCEKKCGCKVELKAWWDSESCPLRKWPVEEAFESAVN